MRPRPLAVVLPLLFAAGMAQEALAAAEPFRDPNLPLERRVDDLVSRLTLDEKIGMLAQVQPAIPRLGIKAFTNFTEGLHGLGWVARRQRHGHHLPAVGRPGRNVGPRDPAPGRGRRRV